MVHYSIMLKRAGILSLLAASQVYALGGGTWSDPIKFDTVTVAAVVSPKNGQIIIWSSWSDDDWHKANDVLKNPNPDGLKKLNTISATYDPKTGRVSPSDITNTQHDMFCPGLSLDFKGRAIVGGGNTSPRTSIYDPAKGWIKAGDLNIGRGYQSQVTISDGRMFTIGGAFSGDTTTKRGAEVYDVKADNWTKLPNIDVTKMFTEDPNTRVNGWYRRDNHGWLIAWKNGWVLQAGPSKQMNWFGTADQGSSLSAGTRRQHQMNGNAVLYDAVAGKVFCAGGAESYSDDGYGGAAGKAMANAVNNADVLTIGAPGRKVTVQEINPGMNHARSFANSIVTPDGKIIIMGGQQHAKVFFDSTAVKTPEIWDPETRKFTDLADSPTARTYHGIAILMPDARIFVGGGGLCGKVGSACGINHHDANIFTPPYLLDAQDKPKTNRPKITALAAAAEEVQLGGTITVSVDTKNVSFSMIRYGSVTHALNTDQRRIKLDATLQGEGAKAPFTYKMTVPADPGVAVPGYWMLFAYTIDGTPSVSQRIHVNPTAA